MFDRTHLLLDAPAGRRPPGWWPGWAVPLKALFERSLCAVLRRPLQRLAAERASRLDSGAARVEAALRGSNVHVFVQDRELRYLSVTGAQGASVGKHLLGRTDDQVLPSTERDAVIAVKRKVMDTGQPADCDVSYVTPQGRAVFALHIEPAIGAGGIIEGVSSTAVDVTRVRSAESEQRRRTDALDATVKRYELALRELSVTVFTQDVDLRYTSISNPLAGRGVTEIVGCSDEMILSEETRGAVIALKRRSLETGTPCCCEIAIGFVGDRDRWFDLHIEPLRDVTGDITGLVGTAIDITRRKEDEAHLRLLMRELTHRSKNLLAVIQAMARHTARHSRLTNDFVRQFEARLQALAAAHDVLVEEGWHGASLEGLARLQLRPFLDAGEGQVSVEGPTVLLKPQAAQALGLALHELANNARKYGALSVPDGKVALEWRRVPQPQGDGVLLKWTESGGPTVATRIARRFGSLVIERHLERAIDGKVHLSFPVDGVRCEVLIAPMHLVGFAEQPQVQPVCEPPHPRPAAVHAAPCAGT